MPPPKYRRGFKTEAEAIAVELRQELELGVHDRLDVWELAEYLGIETVKIGSLRENGASTFAVRQLTRTERSVFSAGTVFRGTRAIIIYNESHPATRTANSVAHEISHVVLSHEPTAQIVFGCRRWDANQENEANWLAGCVLVPGPAALRIARLRIPLEEAADAFGVSKDLMRMRLNLTGAHIRARRAREKRSRS